METEELLEKLSKKFSKPGYVFLPGVRNSTGFPSSIRTADAIAMSLWPSRGLYLHGFELKVSRADWLNELKNPNKAEEIAQYCDFWWLVISDEEIIEKGELPPTWGLMITNGRNNTIKVIKEALQRKGAFVPPCFLASILRSATEGMIPEVTIQTEIDRAKERQKSIDSFEINNFKRQRDEALKAIDDFEEISGLHISTWPISNREFAKTVKEVIDGKYKEADNAMKKIKDSALKIAKYVDNEIKKYEL